MIRYIKYVLVIGIILFMTAAVKLIKPIDKNRVCTNYCYLHGLQCYGYIEKSVYDGTTELEKLLSKEEYMVCFEPKEELGPML